MKYVTRTIVLTEEERAKLKHDRWLLAHEALVEARRALREAAAWEPPTEEIRRVPTTEDDPEGTYTLGDALIESVESVRGTMYAKNNSTNVWSNLLTSENHETITDPASSTPPHKEV